MTDLRTAAQQALEACTDVVSGWESLAPLAVRRAAVESLDALRAALAEPPDSTKPVAESCAYPNCLGGTVGTFCHNACIKKGGHARTTD